MERILRKEMHMFLFLCCLAGMHLPAPFSAVNNKWTEPSSPSRQMGRHLLFLQNEIQHLKTIFNFQLGLLAKSWWCFSWVIPFQSNWWLCHLGTLKNAVRLCPKLGKVRDSLLSGATCVSLVTHKPPYGIGNAPNVLTQESPHGITP